MRNKPNSKRGNISTPQPIGRSTHVGESGSWKPRLDSSKIQSNNIQSSRVRGTVELNNPNPRTRTRSRAGATFVTRPIDRVRAHKKKKHSAWDW